MIKIFKNINFKIFIPLVILLLILTILSFLCAWAEDEGTLGDSFIGLLGAKAFNAFRFPTHTMFWAIVQNSFLLYVIGLLINPILYALLIERVRYLIKIKKTK